MNLPTRVKAVVALVAALGLAGVLVSARAVAHWSPDGTSMATAVVLTVLWTAVWVWPLVVHRGQQSVSVSLDDGFFVALFLLVPSHVVVLCAAAALLGALLIRRVALPKLAFNWGNLVVSTWVATGVGNLVAHQQGTIEPRNLLAAVAGVGVFWLLNAGILAVLTLALGANLRTALYDGQDIALMATGACLALAIPTALVISAYPWALALAVLPLVVLRRVVAGHFEARRDRSRLLGLFHSTLEINRSMGTEETTDAILTSARDLLRCTDASLLSREAAGGDLQAPLVISDSAMVLGVQGRSQSEPFDRADQALLDALAAVGATALTNAALYQEGRIQRERLSAITSSLGEGVCAVDRSGQVTFMNPAAVRMLGWEETPELRDHELEAGLDFGVRAPSFILAPAQRAMAKCDTITNYDTRFTRAEGESFHVTFTVSPILDGDDATGAVLVFRDITERKQFEEQLAKHAFHDALTGLPNRRLFLDHLDHALRRSQRSDEQHAVLFADVDRFKIINDSLGHHSGDQLLIAIANRLKTAVRPGDMLARFGGDEFTLLLEGVTTPEDSIACAQRILDRMHDPIVLPDGHEVVATVSIGIALTSADKSRDDVLHDADVAMYQAKAKGRGGNFEVFDVDAMGVRSAERIDLEAGLRKGLERDELVVHYQPVVSVADGLVVGAEALVRWAHPTRGLLAPGHFIGLAEDTGLILPLGRLVLEKACVQAREWRERFGVALSVAVNLSARQFQQNGLVEEVEDILTRSGVEPNQISLEITEGLAMEDAERTSQVLARLKALGVRVSIDDFGTGYSALGYLASFPVDVVKIDRSFVERVEVDPVKSAIVSAVVTLSQAIGSTAVVEGVETKEQLDHLKSIGCTMVQGYYFAKPMAPEVMTAMLASSMRLQGGAPAEAPKAPRSRKTAKAGRRVA
ncbi:MAG: EAL domain-containing protein [Acidobacteriota bacterium]|nr:EAL domain-containing protein [Acidobacteriota bacterium]